MDIESRRLGKQSRTTVNTKLDSAQSESSTAPAVDPLLSARANDCNSASRDSTLTRLTPDTGSQADSEENLDKEDNNSSSLEDKYVVQNNIFVTPSNK